MSLATWVIKNADDYKNAAFKIGGAPANLLTGFTEELSEGSVNVMDNVTSGVKSSLINVGEGVKLSMTDVATGTENSLFSVARGLESIGKVGLGGGIGGGIEQITSKTGSGIGQGLQSVGEGAGKGLLTFSQSIVPVALVGVLAIIGFGLAKGVSR